jgi:integrase/recombinase XerD
MTDRDVLVSVLDEPHIPHAAAEPAAMVLRRQMTLRQQVAEACDAWLARTPSPDTRSNYHRDLGQFLDFAGIGRGEPERLVGVLPRQISGWRDHLAGQGLTNSSICRKLTVLRSLFSYFQTYGYSGVNPAHGKLVAAPHVPRDGKTVGLSTEDCRRLLDAPKTDDKGKPMPEGIRDRALLAVLAYSGVRVGELCRLRVGDFKTSSGLKLLDVRGKGGKERRVPLHPEAVERLEYWLDCAAIRDDVDGPLFRPLAAARGHGRMGFAPQPITRRAVQYLVERYVERLKLDPSVTVHSFRVTALTVARERGADIVGLQDFAGHADPRTTLTYIRNRDRLSDSPAYLLKY